MTFDWRSVDDDETLEQHFNPRIAVADAGDRIAGYTAAAAAARENIKGWYDFRYGPSPLETYDVHPPSVETLGKPAPMLVFIHGGYWRLLDKSDHSWAATALVQKGVLVVNLNYDLCPAVSLDEIVAEARRAIVHLYGEAASFAADPDRLFVAGHSAGAHMAGMLLNHDWSKEGLPADVIKGAACISGIYEPEAVMRLAFNEDIRLAQEMAVRNDCIRQPPLRPTPIIVSVGGDEPEGWRQQSFAYADGCREAGCAVTLLDVAGANHFTVAEEITQADSSLVQAIIEQIGER